ncbi:MAG TPA: hydrogenase nickel incorporation protein HypB [Bacillota bacterium]|nr:hydrogenase nickel incorporation protein HypB [Bacillota bacterium]
MSRIVVAEPVLKANDLVAARTRGLLHDAGVFSFNMMSSPGSGKTSLLVRVLEELRADYRILVLVGDIQTENDARRLRQTGVEAIQIVTGGTCHLEAPLVQRHLAGRDLSELDLLVIENVGNLVCPAGYDLGEDCKVVALSVTEGDDKPEKYPGIFLRAQAVVLTKTDLLPYVPFDPAVAERHIRDLSPDVPIFPVSTLRGDGIGAFTGWIRGRISALPRAR